MFLAAQNGHLGMVKLLLKHSANPNSTTGKRDPLKVAIKKGRTAIAKVLKQHGAV